MPCSENVTAAIIRGSAYNRNPWSDDRKTVIRVNARQHFHRCSGGGEAP